MSDKNVVINRITELARGFADTQGVELSGPIKYDEDRDWHIYLPKTGDLIRVIRITLCPLSRGFRIRIIASKYRQNPPVDGRTGFPKTIVLVSQQKSFTETEAVMLSSEFASTFCETLTAIKIFIA